MTNYLCNWSRKQRYVYVETPKVACTTVKRILQLAEVDGAIEFKKPGDVHNRELSPLLRPSDDIDEFSRAMTSSEYFRFGFVRNPFTRSLSCYLDKMVKTPFERQRLAPALGLDPASAPKFVDFLRAVAAQSEDQRDMHWASQTYLLRPNRINYSFLGRFEFFRDQFTLLCERLGISIYATDLSNSWHATNAYSKVRDYLGQEEVDLICQIYEHDFRNFGYGWSPEVI
jgi:hypothetical protein